MYIKDPIIFLDIDGVMNGIDRNEKDFLPEAIEVLNYLHQKYKAKIVITSSWREYYTLSYLQKLFHKKGCICEIIDKTSEFISTITEEKTNFSLFELERNKDLFNERAFEILHYIKRHHIKKYIILDDIEITNCDLKSHAILTSYFDKSNLGLNWSYLENIEKILYLKE